ncbi:MAG: 4Fe-4S dicluster domain-containing protein [Actinobacteria bacterium]|nr:4Fe-4S dicluster domain-containing protein [Actinomycetota bacterium]
MYVVAYVDEESCNGCKSCIRSCPEPNAIAFISGDKKVRIVSERCKGCGLCEVECSKASISMVSVVDTVVEDDDPGGS